MDSQRYVSIGDGNAYLVAEDPLDCVVLGALKGLDLRDDVPEGLYSDMTMEA